MVNGKLGLREAAAEGNFQQKCQGAPVDAGAIGIFQGEQAGTGIPLDREGKLPQVAIQNRTDDHRVFIRLHHLYKIFQTGATRAGDHTAIFQNQFNRFSRPIA